MVRSYAKPVEFTLGAQTWLLDDQHCVRRYWTNRIAFRGKGWTVVPAGFRRCAKRSPTGFRSRLCQAPSSVEAIVSPRPQPEDNPVAGTQTWSKRTLSLCQRQKV